MRYYEIVLMIHPDHSDQLHDMLKNYRDIIENGGGCLHRLEDWGRRQLAYPIAKLHKAHYILMNIMCNNQSLDKLYLAFRYNDAVLRKLVLLKKNAISSPSVMMKMGESPVRGLEDNLSK